MMIVTQEYCLTGNRMKLDVNGLVWFVYEELS